MALEWRAYRASRALVSLDGEGHDAVGGQGVDQAHDAGCGQVVYGPGQSRRGPDQAAGGVGEDLDVHPVVLVLAGVVGLLVGDAVDREERAVEDGVGQPGGSQRGGLHIVGQGGEQVDRLAHVSPGGGGPDGEAGGKASVGVPVTQVSQYQQRILVDCCLTGSLTSPPTPPARPPPVPLLTSMIRMKRAHCCARQGFVGEQAQTLSWAGPMTGVAISPCGGARPVILGCCYAALLPLALPARCHRRSLRRPAIADARVLVRHPT